MTILTIANKAHLPFIWYDLGNMPLTVVSGGQSDMNYDFTTVHQMNAVTTRPNFRKKARKGPALLLVALASATIYLTLVP